MRRRATALLLLLGCGCRQHGWDAEAAAHAAVSFLKTTQQADGAFRSDHYGVLRSGCATTATTLLALALLPERCRTGATAEIDRAFAFLAARADGLDDAGDHPNYTLAHWLSALVLLRPQDQTTRMALIARLVDAQFDAGEGFTPDDAAFGGFGLGGRPQPKPLGTALLSVSVTGSVLGALQRAGVAADAAVFQRALVFLRRCQDPDDGGFCFAPEGFLPSKAGMQRDAAGAERPRSYGTMTADGLQALLACGLGDDAPEVTAARRWLALHREIAVVPGMNMGMAVEFEPGLRLYWLQAFARTAGRLRRDDDWRTTVLTTLLPRQRADGAFIGWSDRMKEDDPLVGTCLGLLCLGALLQPER